MVSLMTGYECIRTEKTEVPVQKKIAGQLLAPKNGLYAQIRKLT